MVGKNMFFASLAGLALFGCNSGQEEPQEPQEAASDAPLPEAEVTTVPVSPTQSILRPELEPEPIIEPVPEPEEALVGFPEGGAELDEAARSVLEDLLASDAVAEDWPIVLRGHSDSNGTDRANLEISLKRAEAVVGFLVEQGVAEERITVIGLGEMNPIEPNALPDGTPNEPGRARNRRVEVVISPPAESAQPPSSESTGSKESVEEEKS